MASEALKISNTLSRMLVVHAPTPNYVLCGMWKQTPRPKVRVGQGGRLPGCGCVCPPGQIDAALLKEREKTVAQLHNTCSPQTQQELGLSPVETPLETTIFRVFSINMCLQTSAVACIALF